MIDQVVRALAMDNRPLFIDEADYLVAKPVLLEVLRGIHDVSSSPLILVGMETFKRDVTNREQLAGRISKWVEFQPASKDDARMLADELCEVAVGDDLLMQLHQKSKASIRRIVDGLARVETFARKKNLKKVSLSEWGDRAFSFGEPGAKAAA
jgi:DNA transposition AAA+ family ATPase